MATYIPSFRTGFLPGTAFVVASNAPAAVIREAYLLKSRYGSLIQICDGIADDVEIQAAYDASGDALCSKGNFYLATGVLLDDNDTKLCGCGEGVTTLNVNSATYGIAVGNHRITISDMSILVTAGAGAAGTRPNAIQNNLGQRCNFFSLRIVGDTSVADDGSDIRQCGIVMNDSSANCRISNCDISYVKRHGIAFYCTDFVTPKEPNSNTVVNCNIHHCVVAGIYNYNASHNVITGNTLEANTPAVKLIRNQANYWYGDYNTVVGNNCEGNYGVAIYISGSGGNTITGNQFEWEADIAIYICEDTAIGACGNTISGNVSRNGIKDFCYIHEATCIGNVIIGNTIIDASRNDGGFSAIHNLGAQTVIVGNTIRRTDVAHYQTYGIRNASSATGAIIKGNNLLSAGATAAIWDISNGSNTYDQVIHSVEFDLSAGATDVPTYQSDVLSMLVGYRVFYTEASSGDAGVIVRVGRITSAGASDDDYFDSITSEISKAIGYSKWYSTDVLTQFLIAVGDTVTVGTAGGKTGTGVVKVVLFIAEQVS